MSELTQNEDLAIQNQFQELLHTYTHSDEERNLIRKAYDLAHEAHINMRSMTGEPYIQHLLCVMRIVAEEIGLGATAIMATLLQDTSGKKPDFSIDFISDRFGPKVAIMVDGLNKIKELDIIDNYSSLHAENFRKIMLNISDDQSVILIKIAECLYNMRILNAHPPGKQMRIARETMFLYAPLAYQSGFYSIKQELEDLSLKYRHPEIYQNIFNLMKNNEKEWEKTIEEFMVPIRKKLIENGYTFEMKSRTKSIYSIYYKMQYKGVPFDKIYNLQAIRIVFDPAPDISEKIQCWNIYALITNIYTPKYDQIRDWVSAPKSNGYEALHTTVMGANGKWVEVQIRSRRMDNIAEKGLVTYNGATTEGKDLDKMVWDIAIKNQFLELIHASTFIRSSEDRNLIRKAFDLAREAHIDMHRKAGDPYIIHPLCVARIVVEEIGLGTTSVIAALLHDVVEDNPDYSLDFIRSQFGPKVAMIVDGLTKISGVDVFDKNSSLQAENFRKILLTISDDLRVILIKLADRLHNMRTLDAMPPDKQIKTAGETMFLYAPLAHRLGYYSIKQELEDLSLKYRHPKMYQDIVYKLKDSEEKRNKSVDEFMVPIRKKLIENGYRFEMTGRSKSIYSIYYKMQHKSVPFEEIYDLQAIRIVFDPVPDVSERNQCWSIYTLITDIYMPKLDRIRDWVSMPKANGYEALHITVMGADGKWVEVQIRTRRMDDIAEKGYAAHWKYKGVTAKETELDKWLRKIKELLQDPNTDASELVDNFKMNLFTKEIHVFTPKGQIKTLPQKATALDFAYEIHSEIGHRAIAAKVNHSLRPLNHELHSGDQVEIITLDKKQTQRQWFDEVVTAKAKTSIKNNIKAETKNPVERGKVIFEEKLKQNNVALAPNSSVINKVLKAYDAQTKDELYSKIGADLIKLDDLPKILNNNPEKKWTRIWRLQLFGNKALPPSGNEPINNDNAVSDTKEENIEKFNYKIAKCCNPIPGDDVIGYLNLTNELILIHKSRCPNAVKLTANRGDLIVPVKWTTLKVFSFLAKISIQGIDRPDIHLQIITRLTEELNVNIRTINIASHDGIFEGTFQLYVHNANDLENLMKKIKKLKGVESVKRLEILDKQLEEV